MKNLLLFLALITLPAFAQTETKSTPVEIGNTVTMKVTVEPAPEGKVLGTLRYQWYKGNSGISGANTDTFSLKVAADSVGTYYVAVSNSAGQVRSNQVTLQFNVTIPVIKGMDVTVTK